MPKADVEKPKTKNGYLPPGTSLASAAAASKAKGKGKKEEDEDEGGWTRYEVLESCITTTVEALEGGGKRTVYVFSARFFFFFFFSVLFYSVHGCVGAALVSGEVGWWLVLFQSP